MDYVSTPGQKQMTSSWLRQQLGGPEVAGRKHNSRRQIGGKKTRNLSSAGRGTVRSFPANLSYITAKAPSSSSDITQPCRRLLGVNSCSQLEELPNGYFSHGNLWMNQKQSNNDFSPEMTNMNIPYRTTTLTRSKSANQRTLGVTRSSYTYKRSPSVESSLADINQWRALTPDYSNSAKNFMFNKVPSNNGGVYSYYGNTRINLDDPAGLFYNTSDTFSGPFNLRQPPRVAYEQIKARRNENMALMKNVRKHSSSKDVKKDDSPRLFCPIGQPYDYHSDSPRSFSGNRNSDFSTSNSCIKSADSTNRSQILARTLELGRASVLHQYSAFDNHRHGATQDSDTTAVCCDNPVVTSSNSSLALTGSVQSLPDIDPLYSSNSSLKSENDTAQNLNYRPMNSDSSKNLINNDSAKNTNHRSEDTRPHYYVAPGNRQSSEDLSVSKLFVLRVDKKHQTPKRSVRFKVRDIVHEYEPWAPVKT